MNKGYINNTLWVFRYYKNLGEKAIAQIEKDEDLNHQLNEESNSIALIVKHLSGNMLSRFTNFLTEDGEKSWRNRDQEFEKGYNSRAELLSAWESGWACVFNAIEPLQEADLERTVYIRNEGHTVMEAINRQIAHYAYHVGQIVFLAKVLKGEGWQTLSIAKNKSQNFNNEHFSQEKQLKDFDNPNFYGKQ